MEFSKKHVYNRRMALIDVNFFSKKLFRHVSFKVILPVDPITVTIDDDETVWDKKPFQTLYLLNGVFDDCNAWINNSRILRLAEEKKIAVVMPSGENSFYLDAPGINGATRAANIGDMYSQFISEELVEFTRSIFPLSKKREDTFIGGLSMGGYGALINGLKYHKTFSRIAALSPALMIDDAINSTYNKHVILRNRAFFESYFGDLNQIKESEKNPFWLVENLKKQKVELPKIYLACGKNDHLFPRCEEFASFLMTQETEFLFEKNSGDHDWNFWDTYIERVLNWLRDDTKPGDKK